MGLLISNHQRASHCRKPVTYSFSICSRRLLRIVWEPNRDDFLLAGANFHCRPNPRVRWNPNPSVGISKLLPPWTVIFALGGRGNIMFGAPLHVEGASTRQDWERNIPADFQKRTFNFIALPLEQLVTVKAGWSYQQDSVYQHNNGGEESATKSTVMMLTSMTLS